MTTSTVFEIAESDVPPELAAAHDTRPMACAHPGCTNGITKPARGRASKFCDEHRAASSRSGSRSSVSGKSWPRAQEIENILNTGIGGVSLGLMLYPPTAADGAVLDEKMPAVIHELVELAKTDRKLRKYLEYLAAPGKYAPLTMACFAVALPIMANHNLVPSLSNNEK